MEQLPIRKRIRLPEVVYHQGHAFSITIGTHDRYPWFQKYKDLADSAQRILINTAVDRGTDIFAFCVMPDHIHMLIQDDNVVDFVRLFKGRVTPLARKLEHRKLWQRSFYDHALRKEESIYEIAQYIWENPIRAGIADDPQAYAWSGSMTWPEWLDYYKSG
jgi:REP element-mobilizing transposase RayT